MPSIVLSNELLDLIIYNIDADSLEGRNSLLACSQANRALHIMSQRRGFRDVVLPYNSLRDKHSVLKVEIFFAVGNLSNFETNLPLLPWTDLTNVLNNQWELGSLREVKIMVERLDRRGHRIIHQKYLPAESLLNILDRNEGLRNLREKGIVLYCCP
ncbi:hypothetical protein CPB84DRAFT_1112061 [Gymnopilus junonius]|uniref:Uncharacterized protein n=1 Tax=Gymnopilus junonius TaxID=109634 RepID=A0A9P5N904_GYMJU|nr:hypothetical protein CPB84DRAFT_1112061 [Gymnopilus junonius]